MNRAKCVVRSVSDNFTTHQALRTRHTMSRIQANISSKKLVAPKGAKIGIVQSKYNAEISNALLSSCLAELKRAGIQANQVRILEVPGAFEIPFGCQKLGKKKPDVIITLGALIRGETPHFEYIANSCSQGIMTVSLALHIPIIFGVLTTNNRIQAKARIKGGRRGDKGVEAARSAIQMMNLKA